ncbi:MAG: hypothetical protein K9J37_07685 [Saprospiraceae bacterium]|nr:hypothetical protein [Saprospiraceae bacterium]MCF8249778.1 hypothetical protein [Saprospiraceae bacterium]MCF8279263.1 hypothetical protein [Bacteroidales bacterium]MCF8312811.1 hypothetical protein [Saprospiraceae bacterium]MCF8441258.1 hypothetical protein [Saprospiraceae bacterium]
MYQIEKPGFNGVRSRNGELANEVRSFVFLAGNGYQFFLKAKMTFGSGSPIAYR